MTNISGAIKFRKMECSCSGVRQREVCCMLDESMCSELLGKYVYVHFIDPVLINKSYHPHNVRLYVGGVPQGLILDPRLLYVLIGDIHNGLYIICWRSFAEFKKQSFLLKIIGSLSANIKQSLWMLLATNSNTVSSHPYDIATRIWKRILSHCLSEK